MVIIEIISTTKLNQGKAYVPKRIRDTLHIKDDDHIVWSIDNNGYVIVSNPKTDENILSGIY